jgi:hypothetical protein
MERMDDTKRDMVTPTPHPSRAPVQRYGAMCVCSSASCAAWCDFAKDQRTREPCTARSLSDTRTGVHAAAYLGGVLLYTLRDSALAENLLNKHLQIFLLALIVCRKLRVRARKSDRARIAPAHGAAHLSQLSSQALLEGHLDAHSLLCDRIGRE